MGMKFAALVKNFARDDRGASLLEYSILIGLITAAVIATVGGIGDWIAGQWNTLNTNLTTNQNVSGS